MQTKNSKTAPYYTTIGKVRGGCGHRHGSIATAAHCARSDRDGCRSQGGYSDRVVVCVDTDGERQPLLDHEVDYLAEHGL